MADLNSIKKKARDAELYFTKPIRHITIKEMAKKWMPKMWFEEHERFHPVDFEGLYKIPANEFSNLSVENQEKYKIPYLDQSLTPPIILTPSPYLFPNLKGSGATVIDALSLPEVDINAIYSHGGNFDAAKTFFGARETVSGADNPNENDPYRPRHQVVVRAEFRMFLPTLKAELELNKGKAADGIWGGFDVSNILLQGASLGPSQEARHCYLRILIKAYEESQETGDTTEVESLLNNPPTRSIVNRSAWTALTEFGVMEYHYIYAYNDFRQRHDLNAAEKFFTNEHEGDDEGCGLIFERQQLIDQQHAAPPTALITLAHNTIDHADSIKSLVPDGDGNVQNLDVYIALGSHATYLEPGEHDFFQISNHIPGGQKGIFIAILLGGPAVVAAVILYKIFEKFFGVKDKTSENGITVQSNPDTGLEQKNLVFSPIITPLSQINSNGADENIYDEEQSTEQLAIRTFNGRLGAHSGNLRLSLNPNTIKKSLTDKSPKWENKTKRYFEHLVNGLDKGTIHQPEKPIIID